MPLLQSGHVTKAGLAILYTSGRYLYSTSLEMNQDQCTKMRRLQSFRYPQKFGRVILYKWLRIPEVRFEASTRIVWSRSVKFYIFWHDPPWSFEDHSVTKKPKTLGRLEASAPGCWRNVRESSVALALIWTAIQVFHRINQFHLFGYALFEHLD